MFDLFAPNDQRTPQDYYFVAYEDGDFGLVQKWFWDENGHLDDRYDNQIWDLLPEGFSEAAENVAEYDGSTERGIELLKAAGFEQRFSSEN